MNRTIAASPLPATGLAASLAVLMIGTLSSTACRAHWLRSKVARARYPDLRLEIEQRRKAYARAFRATRDRTARNRLIRQARRELAQRIDRQLMPAWMGTRWDFNGTSATPGQGQVACGIFVATILRHAGFRFHRVRLGILDATAFMRSFTDWRYLKWTSRMPMPSFLALMRRLGEGVYVVGLDFHIGFLVVRGSRVEFVHSSYAKPVTVVREDAARSRVLAASKVKLVGRLMHDPRVMVRWILGGFTRAHRRRPRRAKR